MIHKYGPNRVATFYVGLRRGQKRENRTGRCRALPAQLPAALADHVFLLLRAEQVGSHVGATRLSAEGWFEANHEPSLIYQIVHIPNELEPTPAEFVDNMEALAERLAEQLCQDEILLTYDDSLKRTAYGADTSPPRKKPASHAVPPPKLRRKPKIKRRRRPKKASLRMAA